MDEQARGTGDIDEERGQSDARRECPFTQVALSKAGQCRVGGYGSRLIADERLCREASLPPAGEATAEHGDS
jgi:hypothetical protein